MGVSTEQFIYFFIVDLPALGALGRYIINKVPRL